MVNKRGMTTPEDQVLERAEALNAEQNQLLEEIRKSRQPSFSQPRNVLAQYDRRLITSGAMGQSGFESWGHFLKSVTQCPNGNWRDHPAMNQWVRKAVPTGMNETVGADGQYLVPPEFVQNLLMRTYQNDILSRTTLFPLTTSNTLKLPAVNEISRADGSRFGGVQAYWRSEGGSVTRTKPSLEQISLTVDSLTLVIQVTQELLDDASTVALETFLNLVAPQELAFKIGDAIVNGDGVTKPLGIMNSPAKITQTKEAGQAAATILAANVLKMWSRLHVSCRPNAIWLCDQSIEPALAQMTIGTAGANLVVYQPPGALASAPWATLLGRPLIPVEFCQQLGTEGDLILWDPTTYLTASKGGMQTASSIHVLFETNELLYRFIMRLTGTCWWLQPLTPKSGGPTQSCIVTLQTR